MNSLDRLRWVLESKAQTCVEFLQELVRIDTTVIDQGITGGYEAAGQKIICARLEALGADVNAFEPENARLAPLRECNPGHAYQGRPNVVGVLRGQGGGRSLLLNGHIDTVPTGERQMWQFDPFGAQIHEGHVYGRGAVDMKAGLAGYLMALEAIKEAEIGLMGDVILESVVDEEGGGNGTLACIERGYTADCAVFAEPTQLQVYRAHMGFLFLRIRVHGLARHASLKWEGVNALEKTLKILDALRELEREWLVTNRHPVLPGPTITLTRMQGGIAGSIVPDECEVHLAIHFLPRQGYLHGLASSVEGQVRETLDAVSNADPWLRAHPPEVVKYQEGSAFETEATHPFLDAVAQAARLAGVAPPVVGGAPFGCDARLYANVAGIPCFIFGPGDIRRAHSVDEYVEIDQYLAFTRLLAFAIVAWTSSSDSASAR